MLAIERGVPRFRWNAAINQRVGRVGLLGRLSYYGPWIDYYYTRLWVDAAARRSRTTRPSSTLEATVPPRGRREPLGGRPERVRYPRGRAAAPRRRPRLALQPGHPVGPQRRLHTTRGSTICGGGSRRRWSSSRAASPSGLPDHCDGWRWEPYAVAMKRSGVQSPIRPCFSGMWLGRRGVARPWCGDRAWLATRSPRWKHSTVRAVSRTSTLRSRCSRSRRPSPYPPSGRRASSSSETRTPAICCACSSVPPFDRYAVIPVARNVWQHVEAGSPAAAARRLIIARATRRSSARPVSRHPTGSKVWKSATFGSSSLPAST